MVVERKKDVHMDDCDIWIWNARFSDKDVGRIKELLVLVAQQPGQPRRTLADSG
jgi:hypothetical protein